MEFADAVENEGVSQYLIAIRAYRPVYDVVVITRAMVVKTTHSDAIVRACNLFLHEFYACYSTKYVANELGFKEEKMTTYNGQWYMNMWEQNDGLCTDSIQPDGPIVVGVSKLSVDPSQSSPLIPVFFRKETVFTLPNHYNPGPLDLTDDDLETTKKRVRDQFIQQSIPTQGSTPFTRQAQLTELPAEILTLILSTFPTRTLKQTTSQLNRRFRFITIQELANRSHDFLIVVRAVSPTHSKHIYFDSGVVHTTAFDAWVLARRVFSRYLNNCIGTPPPSPLTSHESENDECSMLGGSIFGSRKVKELWMECSDDNNSAAYTSPGGPLVVGVYLQARECILSEVGQVPQKLVYSLPTVDEEELIEDLGEDGVDVEPSLVSLLWQDDHEQVDEWERVQQEFQMLQEEPEPAPMKI